MLRNSLIIISVLFWASAGEAQITNDLTPFATQERSKETLEYFQDQARILQEPALSEANLVEQLAQDSGDVRIADHPVSFILTDIETSSSQVLFQDEIDHIVDPYKGRQVGLNDIYEIIDRINLLYKEKKVFTARAILPVQDIRDGIVRVELIEGRVGKLIVQGN